MRTTPEHDIALAALLRDNEVESVKLTSKKQWWAIWSLGALLTISVLSNVYQGTQHRWIIRYVEVDKASQQTRVIEPAAERYEPDVAIAKYVLGTAIKTLRSVPKDKQRMDDDFEALKVCMTPTGRQRLKEYEAREKPRQEKYPRVVQIVSLRRKTPRSYDARWQEWKYGASDQQDGPTTFYTATLDFERRDPRTETELTHCPTGIFLDLWSLGKDQ